MLVLSKCLHNVSHKQNRPVEMLQTRIFHNRLIYWFRCQCCLGSSYVDSSSTWYRSSGAEAASRMSHSLVMPLESRGSMVLLVPFYLSLILRDSVPIFATVELHCIYNAKETNSARSALFATWKKRYKLHVVHGSTLACRNTSVRRYSWREESGRIIMNPYPPGDPRLVYTVSCLHHRMY